MEPFALRHQGLPEFHCLEFPSTCAFGDDSLGDELNSEFESDIELPRTF